MSPRRWWCPIQVYPGEVAELDVVLVNNGRHPATFLEDVEGWFDEGWLAPPPPVTLQAGEPSTVALAIAPPRRPETEAGRNPPSSWRSVRTIIPAAPHGWAPS